MTDWTFYSVERLAAFIRAKRVSAVEVLEAHLWQIEQHNPRVNAVITLQPERALDRAREADAALARGEVWGPLHGVPFALKDAFATAGVRTTTGSPSLDHVPDRDSTVAARLTGAGAVLMGKTNVATLLGDPGQTGNPIFGRTNNPWNLARTPGGSSGGAAAAVAAGMTPFDIGTDLSGSIRIPAHFCGLFGLKPTERRVSLDGLIPGLTTPRAIRIMSAIGPLARSVEDLALLFGIIAGPDGRDTEIPPGPIDAVADVELASLRIGLAPTFPGLPVAVEIRQAIDDLAHQLSSLGTVIEEAVLPAVDFDLALQRAGELIGMLIGAFEAAGDHRPTTLAHYLEALHWRDEAMLAWERFFDQWDVLLCPAAMTTAFPHCEPGSQLLIDGHAVSYWLVSAHATLFSYTGHPAIVLPYRLDQSGLPIGVQIVGRRWAEARLLAAAQAIAQVTGDFRRPPGY